MKIKIIKPYELRPGRVWPVETIVMVTPEFAAPLLKEGYARELRIEMRKTDDGIEFPVEIEVIDKTAQFINKEISPTDVDKNKQRTKKTT